MSTCQMGQARVQLYYSISLTKTDNAHPKGRLKFKINH